MASTTYPPARFVALHDSLDAGLGAYHRALTDSSADAQIVRILHASLVPGILQTEGWMRCLLPSVSRSDLDDFVAERFARQQQLGVEGGPEYRILMFASALRLWGVPTDVLSGQVDRLIAAVRGSGDGYTFGVIPDRVIPHPDDLAEPWIVDDHHVLFGVAGGSLQVHDPLVIQALITRFEATERVAVHGEAAVELLRAAAGTQNR